MWIRILSLVLLMLVSALITPTFAQPQPINEVAVVTLVLTVVAIYIVPAVVAFVRGHEYKWVIFGLNLFGFTGFLWIIAFIWAVWPANRALAEPLIGNVTGTGQKNLGDAFGQVKMGVERGYFHEYAAPHAAGTAMSPPLPVDVIERLARLEELKSSGAMSENEFRTMKERLFSSLVDDARLVKPRPPPLPKST